MKKLVLLLLVLNIFLISCNNHAEKGKRWSVEKANEWYAKQPWLVGCNFIPSTAVNQLEMWQEETILLSHRPFRGVLEIIRYDVLEGIQFSYFVENT